MTAQDYERLAVQAIADVERREVERAILGLHAAGMAAAIETARMVDAMRHAERTHDEPEVELAHESESPGWRDYAGALVFAVLVIVAWCWVCVLGSAS